jgi:hypothetical protein
MTYEESAELMQDATFRGRVKVACLKYADFIQLEPVTTPGHTSRLRWAQGCFQQADMTAITVQPPTVMDPAVQAEGAAITDAGLQSAVEGVVNKLV